MKKEIQVKEKSDLPHNACNKNLNKRRKKTMPNSKNLPTSMCPTCAYYEYHKASSVPHHCTNAGSFTNSSKVGHNPDKEGTGSSCKIYKPAR